MRSPDVPFPCARRGGASSVARSSVGSTLPTPLSRALHCPGKGGCARRWASCQTFDMMPPPTPSSSRAQVPEPRGAQMGHYQLGDCLGRGAFGSVYRGLNWMTGETVAVKQIQLGNIPKSELGEIMSEIDLLKNLKHPNIVKYKGSEKTRDHLNIILEYCENGSLQHICKRFGKFPEGLVGVYISQVLDGLCYLHDQGVIHRDIKGANILTTKDGSVKLADFGVATKAGSLLDGNNPVVGSPYWMAPEVIDQSGATTASDVWSVGCVVIELLDGKPPYHFLDPMPALFRIVQDDCPPLPEGASPIVKDFLIHCFQKDANLRVSARKLCRHPWMMSARRQLDQMRSGGSLRGDTVYDEAVKSVQEWNEALKEPVKATTGVVRAHDVVAAAMPPMSARRSLANKENNSPGSTGLHRGGNNTSAVAAKKASQNPSLAPATTTGRVTAASVAAPAVTTVLVDQRHKLKELQQNDGETDNWDDDFEDGISTRKLAEMENPGVSKASAPVIELETASPPQSVGAKEMEAGEDNFATIRPRKRQVSALSSPEVEDYSDLLGEDDDESHLGERVKRWSEHNGSGVRLFHPSDIPQQTRGKATTSSATVSHPVVPTVPEPLGKSARQSLKKYAEGGTEEDYSDLVALLDQSSLQLTVRLSSRSWLGDDESEEDDPFAEFEQDEFVVGADLEANVARDKNARMCAHIVALVERLHTRTPEDDLIETCDELESILTDQPELKGQVLAAHGALAVLQLLEAIQIRDIISRLLGLLNVIIYQDVLAQETLCLIGAIPVVMTFTSKKYPHDVRIEAAHFVFAMCSTSNLTLQFVLSCRGLKTLVELIDEDYSQQRDLVWLGVGCVNSVLELQSPASRNDFCRMLATEGLLDPLTTALLYVIDDDEGEEAEGEYTSSAKNHILQTLLIYSSSDTWLKEKLATRSVLRRILQACQKLEPASLTVMLKAIKNLSMSPSILDEMENCNTIEVLIKLLGQHHDGTYGTEMSNQVLNTIYNLCRLNKRRQEEAAQAGIIPQLLRVAKTTSPLKQFALPILCDLAHASKSTRKMLNQQCGLEFFLELLQDPYWQLQSLESILIWLQEDLARMESTLLKPSSIQSLLFVFTSSKSLSFEQFLETFLKIFKLSDSVTFALGKHGLFLKRLVERLQSCTKAVVKLNLLRICKATCDVLPNRQEVIQQYGLMEIIEKLSREDPAILVREVAKEIVTQFRQASNGLSLVAKEAHRTVRRAASENNVAQASSLAASTTASSPSGSAIPQASPRRAQWNSAMKKDMLSSVGRVSRPQHAAKSRLFQQHKHASEQ